MAENRDIICSQESKKMMAMTGIFTPDDAKDQPGVLEYDDAGGRPGGEVRKKRRFAKGGIPIGLDLAGFLLPSSPYDRQCHDRPQSDFRSFCGVSSSGGGSFAHP